MAAPWGHLHVAAGERGIVALESLTLPEAFAARIERRLRQEVRSGSSPLVDAAVAQLEEYFDGRRRAFELAIDISDRPAWDRAVLAAVNEVPWGAVTTYGSIARDVDRPGAARAVGGAVGRSPIGIVIPCHRVIAADGSLGGYGSDGFASRATHLEVKRDLLALEGIEIAIPRD
ncbi:MAG TPA: methylated-DNA--[protein]-cysteine S-methyltransferase [Candidatus Limnocylindrales bacterium]|nr:methylated-DNA--[protein]-cysteine S-methyltransferase [Candidatus Limnocylindrales bacterium]